jgi:hypothetical protein
MKVTDVIIYIKIVECSADIAHCLLTFVVLIAKSLQGGNQKIIEKSPGQFVK